MLSTISSLIMEVAVLVVLPCGASLPRGCSLIPEGAGTGITFNLGYRCKNASVTASFLITLVDANATTTSIVEDFVWPLASFSHACLRGFL